jgi:SepF-like predicted cell division protein (DUF552 family)
MKQLLIATTVIVLLASIVFAQDFTPLTGLAITDVSSVESRRTILTAIVIVVGAALMLYLLLKKRAAIEDTGTRIIADSVDEPLIPFTMLQDADQVLDKVISTKAHSWTQLFAHYPPLVVHACKAALKEVRTKPSMGVIPEPADYIGAATFARLVRVLASNKLAGELKQLQPHTHTDYHEVAPIDEQELAILRHVKLTQPSDVEQALTLIRHGKGIVLIDVSRLENNEQLKSVLKKIKRTAEANDGAVLGVGTYGILATNTIPIHTGGAKHGTV